MMAMRRLAILLLTSLALAAPARAVQPDEILPDAAMEQRARAISGGLRCLVCQNQSIDDSDAPLARDLRVLVRERLQAGDSDSAVRDFVVARYGEFVLLSPPFSWRTAALWGAPFLILMASLAYIGRRTRRMTSPAMAAQPLSEDERRRLERLMQD
jgi:cytochrome c-type biogenesis protein CcmH